MPRSSEVACACACRVWAIDTVLPESARAQPCLTGAKPFTQNVARTYYETRAHDLLRGSCHLRAFYPHRLCALARVPGQQHEPRLGLRGPRSHEVVGAVHNAPAGTGPVLSLRYHPCLLYTSPSPRDGLL